MTDPNSNQILWRHPLSPSSGREEVSPSEDTPPPSFWQPVLEAYEKSRHQPPLRGENIKVNQALSALAVVYEKVRNAVDFRSEHLFRRHAIERILRRRWISKETADYTAISLIKELIWGGYFPNDSLPQNKAEQITVVLKKYQTLKAAVGGNGSWNEWFLDLAATEIDELLVSASVNRAWVNAAATWIKSNFLWQDPLTEEEKDRLWFLAVDRAFLRIDDQVARYHLWILRFPDWESADSARVQELGRQLFKIREDIETTIGNPLSNQLFRLVRRQIPALWVLKSLWDNTDNLPALLEKREELFAALREICQRRYSETGQKVRRGIVRSIVYIFATKTIFALALEWPYEQFLGTVNYLPIIINLLIPPFLMFFLGLLIHVPGEENTIRITRKVNDFLSDQEALGPRQTLYLAKRQKGRGFAARSFAVFYLLLFVFVFGGLSFGLIQLGYTWVSLVIFFFFVCLVLLFGFRVLWTAQELLVIEKKEGLIASLVNLFSLPFIDVGARLSRGLVRFNFLTIILDLIIEAPLKLVIDIFSDFANFVRKKREEVIEVPM